MPRDAQRLQRFSCRQVCLLASEPCMWHHTKLWGKLPTRVVPLGPHPDCSAPFLHLGPFVPLTEALPSSSTEGGASRPHVSHVGTAAWGHLITRPEVPSLRLQAFTFLPLSRAAMKNRGKFLLDVVALHKKGRLLTWEQRAEARWNPQCRGSTVWDPAPRLPELAEGPVT